VLEPSAELIALLERLRLATPGQVRSHLPQVRRLAGDLPLFDSVWIDALVQARMLTPLQAGEINAARGERLAVGPLVIERRLPSLGYAECFQARERESGEPRRLYLIPTDPRVRERAIRQLAELIERSRDLPPARLLPVQITGAEDDRLWAATPPLGGQSAAEWMVENGRFPPASVLYIAQEMTAALAALAERSIVHGDISAASLLIGRGRVVLAHPGLRGIVRPAEGYAHNNLFPAAYDYLAPERIAAGTPPTLVSDLYACGALWWHLLTGRPPFAGGNSLAKLQSVHAARVTDVRRLAPETPAGLARVIARCLSPAPAERISSIAELAAALGSPARGGGGALARLVDERKRVRVMLGSSARAPAGASSTVRRVALPAIAAALAIAVCWPAWRRGDLLPRLSAQPTDGQTVGGLRPNPAGGGAVVAQVEPSPAGQQPPGTTAPAGGTQLVAHWTEDQTPPLVLPTDRPITLEKLSLLAGQVVRGEQGGRPRVLVPARGLVVAVEDVTFENIDFVAPASGEVAGSAQQSGIVVLAAVRGEFRGCSFHDERAAAGRRTGIVWRGPGRSRQAASDWTGQLVLRNCVAGHLSSAIEVVASLPTRIELANSLFVDCGVVARLRRPAIADGSCELVLDHVTARETGPIIAAEYDQPGAEIGRLAITANESTFAPRSGEPLLLMSADSRPESLAAAVEWQGQGSLVTSATWIAAWRSAEGRLQPLADELLTVAGLVRGDVEFAGASLSRTADSRAIRWQVPLQSAEPPGIGDDLP
jgi:eukaryotic-like serine/threonine-protein kinase